MYYEINEKYISLVAKIIRFEENLIKKQLKKISNNLKSNIILKMRLDLELKELDNFIIENEKYFKKFENVRLDIFIEKRYNDSNFYTYLEFKDLDF